MDREELRESLRKTFGTYEFSRFVECLISAMECFISYHTCEEPEEEHLLGALSEDDLNLMAAYGLIHMGFDASKCPNCGSMFADEYHCDECDEDTECLDDNETLAYAVQWVEDTMGYGEKLRNGWIGILTEEPVRRAELVWGNSKPVVTMMDMLYDIEYSCGYEKLAAITAALHAMHYNGSLLEDYMHMNRDLVDAMQNNGLIYVWDIEEIEMYIGEYNG